MMGEAYDLYKEFFRLAPKDQEYVLGYFTGSLDCVASGFTTPHPDQAHAQWAISELEKALNKKRLPDRRPKQLPAVKGNVLNDDTVPHGSDQ